MSDPYCPVCGGCIEHDAVDIGVGTMYGPAFCIDCGWSEGNEQDESPFDAPESYLDADESDQGRRRSGRPRTQARR